MLINEKFRALMVVYNRWKNISVNRSILGATFVIAIVTTLAKILFFTKELVIAWRFGTSDLLDAFLIAYVIPAFIVNLISSSFNAALVPMYIHVREVEGHEQAVKLYASIMTVSVLFLLVCTGLMILFAPIYLGTLASGFDEDKLRLTQNLLYFVSPVIVFSGITTLRSAILNAGEKFAVPGLIPAITPLLTILFIWFAGDSWNIYSVVLGMISGQILESAILGFFLKHRGVIQTFAWDGFNENLRQVIAQLLPMIAGAFLMGSTILVDQAMAASLPAGNVAVLNYGNKVISFPLQIAATAIGTAVLPYFSAMLARRDFQGAYATLHRYLKMIFLTTIPLTLFLFVFSEPLVSILLQRGAFTAQDAKVVANVQALGALQIPFYLGGLLVVRMISAMKANYILLWGAILNLAVNYIGNFTLMRIYGVAGISFSTSFVYVASFLYLYLMFLLKYRRINEGR